jgi:hypothetical protein
MVKGTQSGSGLENQRGENELMSGSVHYLSRRTPTGKTRTPNSPGTNCTLPNQTDASPHITMEEVEDEEDEEDLFTHNDLPDLQEDSDDEEEEEDKQLEKGDRVYTINLTPNTRISELEEISHNVWPKPLRRTKRKKTSKTPCPITSATSKISSPKNHGAR